MIGNKTLAWTTAILVMATVAILIRWVTYDPITTLPPRKEATIRRLEQLAQEQADKRAQMFDAAMASGNVGVACKIGREMLFWVAQTHNVEEYNAKNRQLGELCRHE